MFVVMTIRDNVPDDLLLQTENLKVATAHFLDACQERMSNFDEYTTEDIAAILQSGYAEIGCLSVCLLDLSNTRTV